MRVIANVLLLAFVAESSLLRTNSSTPINEKVTVDGSTFAGDTIAYGCSPFTKEAAVTVCGVRTKVTIYMRARCEGYYQYMQKVGQCDTKMDTNGCQTYDATSNHWIAAAQSYKVEVC
eukprot:gnl/MRDRNA2_/MRDRNA2_60305_c0_seq1.p2 gnl/MRDRNA2_/MRDRNA2_60305_c0~~gnl/MRDRNA2_/MRDRNA2_60305_c0_seq1.p2  ORF type:complete len:118 (+),score=20.16 gnl/MRDRNA2_/MRDRNA2_60305_c0_seq1:82-435(+)